MLLARHFDQQLTDFIVVQERHCRASPARTASPRRQFQGTDVNLERHEALKAKVGAYSDVAGVNVFDADGMLINSSGAWPVPISKSPIGPTSRPSNQEPRPRRFRSNWCEGRFSEGLGNRHRSQDDRAEGRVSRGRHASRSGLPALRNSSHPWRLEKVRRLQCSTRRNAAGALSAC